MRRVLIALIGSMVLSPLTAPAHAASARPEGFRVESSIPYVARADGSLRLDAYLPDADAPVPAILVIHGGGWSAGSRADVAPVARALAGAGFAAFAIDYRLAPAHPYPAAVEDAAAAVRWVRRQADRYGIDPTRIAALGGSAGGHLAAMLGVLGSGPRDRGARVAAVATWSAPLDLERTVAETAAGSRPGLAAIVDGFLGCPLPCAERAWAASPISHIDGTDAAMLVVNGTDEIVPLGPAEAMVDRLSAAGVPSLLRTVPGSLHSWQYAAAPVGGGGDTALEATIVYLSSALSSKRSGAVPGRASGILEQVLGIATLAAAALLIALLARWRDRRRLLGWTWRSVLPDAAAIEHAEALGRGGLSQREVVAALSAAHVAGPRAA
ncbi:MAG TPA: alpha/beta hydrolase [Actinomycetota bacterium]